MYATDPTGYLTAYRRLLASAPVLGSLQEDGKTYRFDTGSSSFCVVPGEERVTIEFRPDWRNWSGSRKARPLLAAASFGEDAREVEEVERDFREKGLFVSLKGASEIMNDLAALHFLASRCGKEVAAARTGGRGVGPGLCYKDEVAEIVISRNSSALQVTKLDNRNPVLGVTEDAALIRTHGEFRIIRQHLLIKAQDEGWEDPGIRPDIRERLRRVSKMESAEIEELARDIRAEFLPDPFAARQGYALPVEFASVKSLYSSEVFRRDALSSAVERDDFAERAALFLPPLEISVLLLEAFQATGYRAEEKLLSLLEVLRQRGEPVLAPEFGANLLTNADADMRLRVIRHMPQIQSLTARVQSVQSEPVRKPTSRTR